MNFVTQMLRRVVLVLGCVNNMYFFFFWLFAEHVNIMLTNV